MTHTPPVAGPYLHKNKSIRRSMMLVMAALVPATAYGFYMFGWPAILLFVITLGSAVLIEIFCLLAARRPVATFAFDGSGIVTAWLIAISLPPWAPWWIGVLGAGVAMVLGKHVYGGLGQNVFNPAMVARVVLLISFPLEMTTFVDPAPLLSAGAPSFMDGVEIVFGLSGFDAMSGASVLEAIRTGVAQGHTVDAALGEPAAPVRWMMGTMAGSMGEGAALLLAAGGIFLIFQRVITWYIPVSMIVSVAVIATLFNLVDGDRYADAAVHVLAGATILTAFFIATDPVTSPMSPRGQLVYGASMGVLIYILRTWSAYPEGASFAVLLMNALAPVIDRYMRPRIFGRDMGGVPLSGRGGS